MRKELFTIITEALKRSTEYNLKTHSVELKLSQIKNVLSDAGIKDSQRIENACKLIAQNVSHEIKNNITSFSNLHTNLHFELESASREISSTRYLQSTMYTKSSLNNSIKNCDLEDGFRKRIEEKVELVCNNINKDDSKDVIIGVNSLKEISNSLTQHINDLELPTWFGEIFFQCINNDKAANANLESIRSIETSIDLDDAKKQAIQKCLGDAYNVKTTIEKNNELLKRIEYDIDSKRSGIKNLQSNLTKFMATVADGVVLKILQENNKSILTQIKSLDIALQKTPQYFSNSEEIESYSQGIAEMRMPISQVFRQVFEAEKDLGIKSLTYGNKIRDIEKSLDELYAKLEIEKVKIANCVHSPIPEDILIWERSGWQSLKTSWANFSQFFTGHEIHTKIYGYPEGVEELRRAIEDLPEDTIKIHGDLYIAA